MESAMLLAGLIFLSEYKAARNNGADPSKTCNFKEPQTYS